jgi:molybdate/tungstate transport system substrate-binding protein
METQADRRSRATGPGATILGVFSAMLAAFGAAFVGCRGGGEGAGAKRVIVVHADSLARPFAEVKRAFEAAHPGIEVALEPYGSLVACRNLESGAPCDVVALADRRLFDELLIPKGLASWYVAFCCEEIVIIKSSKSRFNAEITADNWPDILTRPGVKVGVADPAIDPCGYWARLVWKLADKAPAYAKYSAPDAPLSKKLEAATRDFVRPDSQMLIALVDGVGGWDYAFVYKAQAEQMRLSYVRLPPEVNLGSDKPEHLRGYAEARTAFSRGSQTVERMGERITFAASIPASARAPAEAEAFLAFLLGPDGRAACRAAGLELLAHPWAAQSEKLPLTVSKLTSQKN